MDFSKAWFSRDCSPSKLSCKIVEGGGIGPSSQCVFYLSCVLGLLCFCKEKSNVELQILKSISNGLLKQGGEIVL